MQIVPQVVSAEPANPEMDLRLREFAHQLAGSHFTEIADPPKRTLLDFLPGFDLSLRNANAVFKAVPSMDLPVSRAAEWMLDNFYIIKQTFRQIGEDLPGGFFEQLPRLAGTSLQGSPRIFALAWEWIGYCQGQIDLTLFESFVQDYQEVQPLTIGELWALPVMLRIGILERLVYAAAELTRTVPPNGLSEIPARFASASSLTSDSIVANCFLSLRFLFSTDWKDFFEKTSLVEQILRQDPAGIYSDMDFQTRNNYRSVIEEVARHSKFSEEQVALEALKLSRKADQKPRKRIRHIGYYLLDLGRADLEKKAGYQPGFMVRVRRALLAFPTQVYLGSILSLSLIFVSAIFGYAALSGGSISQLMIVSVLGFGLALEAAIALVHWNVTHGIKPQSLPRLDFSKGIPSGNRTMVVVPTLLESPAELNHLLQELELYYLSNPDPQLTYALLTDFGDAPERQMPQDEELLSLAISGIENLNKKYKQAMPFYLFHRRRQWNPSEGVWMGWERKRGKLADFNRLLLNLGETPYTSQVGEAGVLSSVKYVITLDADTSLPQGSANRLIATLAHPLNHAEFSADGRSVVAGYTVLQPRVAIKPTSANRSIFSQIFAGNSGFDLYSFAVSDVYQDLFGEGSYVGKGIYDVAAFERSLSGQVRQNTLLSHDLFEGIYGRAALVTDIVLYEEYPWRYPVYARRLRRWIRGDWQLLPWLFPIVRVESGTALNRLSIINRWKVFDNLRRSLVPPTLLTLMAAGWLVLPGSPLIWTLLVLLPSGLPIMAQTIRQVRENSRRLSFMQILKSSQLPLFRWGLSIIFLPYEALLMLGAIGTTLGRILIARRNLLQWTTAANTARSFGLNAHYETWGEMSGSLVLTALLGLAIVLFHSATLWVAFPLLFFWMIAPQIAYWISRPAKHVTPPLSEMQRRKINRLARRTWAFFEQFAGPDDHWLPPDHFQETPRGNVAHYTTPTNIGLFLVSTLSAYEMGYIGLFELAVRLRSTFESISKLEHYRGHLLNWYDSQTLTALPPRYISTVDSGNLAASLITLRQGCLELLKTGPLLGEEQWQGLLVILDILQEALQSIEKNDPFVYTESFAVELTNIYERIHFAQNKPEVWIETLAWLSGEGWKNVSHRLLELLESHANLRSESLTELQTYLDLLHHHLQDMQRNLDLFAPWLSRLEEVPSDFIQSKGWQEFRDGLPAAIPTLGEAVATYRCIQNELQFFSAQLKDASGREWCRKLMDDLSSAHMTVRPLQIAFQGLADLANSAVTEMDFRFLFNERRQVFHIGYNASTEKLDPSFYDLLASEARIASLVAIAKGDVPQSHWQHLGRPVTLVNGKQVLLSWSGTMFEYLMPTLFTKNYDGTFLSDSCYAALEAQLDYGDAKEVPWGISESGYFAFDMNLNYQYQAFGVPDLGYKRTLPEDLVIAPYASLLGLSLQPRQVLDNMDHLERLKMIGRFGFYEAIDYTKTRLLEGQTHVIVKSYMAHHQGMILMAACNYLSGDVMVRRFHADERIQSVELLLQEKVPQNPPLEYPHLDEPAEMPEAVRAVSIEPWQVPVDSPIPQAHVLSFGDASLLITNAGGGFSQWRDVALTRWHADATLDQWGTWIYVQDCGSGALWSATCQPIGCLPEKQDVKFYPHKVEFQRSDHGISLRTGITISTDGVEIRRVNILNESDRPRRLKLTSYGEVVLAAQAADRRHPAFNKLFIESEYLPRENALLFQRRSRSADEKPVVMIHALIIEAGRKVTGEYETDRASFLGRSQTMHSPQALQNPNVHPAHALVANHGSTLDPILSLGQEVNLKPHAKTRVTFLTLAASTRAEALEKLSRYESGESIHRAFDDARASAERELLKLGMNAASIENIQRLYSALIYPVGTLRAEPHILAQNGRGQPDLWAFGISGDFPILLLRVRDGESPLLREALQAFLYWRARKVSVNLVVLNDQDTGYALDLHYAIQRQIRSMGADVSLNQRDGIFVLRTDQLQQADRVLFETVAGVILDERRGTLAEHALRLTVQPTRLPQFAASLSSQHDLEATSQLQAPDHLVMDNGLGGFSSDGREYVIHLQPGQHTPRPWINVISNPQLGFLVSEAGLGSTWSKNSGENRLTPWRNDPVTDMPGEAIYLRDEETSVVWSPTPMPAGEDHMHIIRHGAGYSVFESQSHGLSQRLRLFVAPQESVKVAHLRLQNLWERPRRITVTYYAEWVLGTTRDTHQAHIMPEFVPDRNALLATNSFNGEFGGRVAFLAGSKKPHSVTTDRTEFLGRMGSMRAPAALDRIGLASAVNAGLDPCAVMQLHVDLAPGAIEEVFFLIGQGADRAESLALIGQIQTAEQVEAVWRAVQLQWDEILDAITVETPDPGMDLMLNRWMLYQTLSCRLWGRTALYQSSGAFGFRDQLQDAMALLHSRPDIVRAQIIESARHQFEEGDVLHWWNPPAGRGVRTRFSDDLLWLPFVTAEYVASTGDSSILAESVPFLKGEALKPGEMERYAKFETGDNSFTLYEHCRRALEKGVTRGSHGLPLMGGGDWNDGMNRVGMNGQGESVWLGWFLLSTLRNFTPLVLLMAGDPASYLVQAEQLEQALEAHAWDGDWYLRAFYDDGSRLGSHLNHECQIDSIAQSWAVLSGAANPTRAAQAMESVYTRLVNQAGQIILLFTPPFDRSLRDPGYIKGYPPGVRENGGQYTHAAIWSAWAFARLGQGDRAWELFRMLNPINHADTPAKVERYKVEPYVIAADIYSVAPHIGMGGWTWYTGSAGWMYRLGMEGILGITRMGTSLQIQPCIPSHWPGFKVDYRFGHTHYRIAVENPRRLNRGMQHIFLDGEILTGPLLQLVDDGQPHEVRVILE